MVRAPSICRFEMSIQKKSGIETRFDSARNGLSVFGLAIKSPRHRVDAVALRFELVRLESNSPEIIRAWFEGQFDVPLLPAFRFAVDGNFVELVLGFMPQFEGQLGASWEFFNLHNPSIVADADVRMIGDNMVGSHPRMDIAFDLGWAAFGLLDLEGFYTAVRDHLVPFVVIKENELCVVTGGVRVLHIDGLPCADMDDVRNELAVDVIKDWFGGWDVAKVWVDFVVRKFRLFGIDHEYHVRDPFGVFIDDESFVGDALFRTERVGLSVHGGKRGYCPIEDKLHRDIGPFLSANEGAASNDRRACDQGSPFHI